MASAVMAPKLKCGSTLASISWISFVRLPALISLSLAMRSTTSSVTFFTSWSGGTSCARATGTVASAAAAPAATSAALASLLILVAVIFRFLLPWRAAIVDEAAAPLEISVALEHVLVERGLLQNAARVEQVGPQLSKPDAPQAVLQVIGPHITQRIGVDVDARADAIAQVARAEERQHDVRARRRAPAAEGLAEIFVVLLVSHIRGNVVQAEEPYSGIKRKARPIADTVLEFPLQEIVHADEGVGEVAEEVTHALAYLGRHDLLVSRGHRPRDRGVDLVVELVDAAVQRFPRIARVALGGAGAARGRAHERGEQQDAHHFAGSFASGLPSAALLNRNWLIRFSSTTAD